MKEPKYVRVGEAAHLLGISVASVRNYTKDGRLPFTLSPAGHRLIAVEDINRIVAPPEKEQQETHIYYVRSSSKNDVSHENQIQKLQTHFPEPTYIFSDTSSGLNDNRKGLNSLISTLKKTQGKKTVYVTNKDRLTRFGFKYLEHLFEAYNCKIEVLDSDETKEPLEVLMQDFMNLLASFSGKFYRLRGWKQQKQFLETVEKEIEKHE